MNLNSKVKIKPKYRKQGLVYRNLEIATVVCYGG